MYDILNLIPEEINKKEVEPIITPGDKAISDSSSTSSTVNVPQNGEPVKENQAGIRNSIEASDADYMAAVESGDMETAQRMVNERAAMLKADVFAATDVPTYRVRRTAAPKKTVKVYKTFRSAQNETQKISTFANLIFQP